MSAASLTVQPVPGLERGRVVEVDCKHGRTQAVYANGTAPGAPQLTDADMAAAAVARHYLEERCRCTRQLRQHFGLTD